MRTGGEGCTCTCGFGGEGEGCVRVEYTRTHTRIHAYTHIQDCSGGGTSNYASGGSDNFSRYDGLVKWWYLASSAGQPSGTAVTDTAVVVALSGAYGGGNGDGDGSSDWLATAIGDGSAAPDGQYRCYMVVVH